jgi:hypothetical protein
MRRRRCPPHYLEADGWRIATPSHMIYSDRGGQPWRVGENTRLGDGIDEVIFRAGLAPEGKSVWA